MPSSMNYVSGTALQKLYQRGPSDFKYYLGGTVKPLRPDVIYDFAKDDTEVYAIMGRIKKALRCRTEDLTFGEISQNTLSTMYDVCKKNYPHPQDSQIYKIRIGEGPNGGSVQKNTFDEWCISRKGRLYKDAGEKVSWFLEWKQLGN